MAYPAQQHVKTAQPPTERDDGRNPYSAQQLALRIKQGKSFEFSFMNESLSHDAFSVTNINQCEFIALSPNMNVVSVRSSDTSIDLLATQSLSKVSQI